MVQETLTVLLVDPGLAPRGPRGASPTHESARALDRLCAAHGIALEACAGATQALEHIARRPPEVVVVAQHLPDGDGIELLRTLSEDRPRIKRMLVMSDPSALNAALAAINQVGIARMLCRPFTFEQLVAALGSLREQLARERRHDALAQQAVEQHIALSTLRHELDALVDHRTAALLDGLLAALAHRDSETRWHSRRVALYTHTMAWMMGLRDGALSDIQRGALLHDIGKIGIPDAIVLKPGPLTAEEWAIMKTHPRIGFDLLANIDFLRNARQLVLEHHERWDGGGYPHGLTGEAISLGARIFAVADTLDAMTSDRPYRAALPFAAAYDEIVAQAGRQFDPKVVAAFQAIPRPDWELAVALGQAHERAPLLDHSADLERWRQSAFVQSFGTIDPDRAWFQINVAHP